MLTIAHMIDLEGPVGIVRRFNRFYTRQIGVLEEHLLGSQFSLTQARVLYEVSTSAPITASRLSAELGLDPGYLSRVLSGFDKAGLIERVPSETDGRQSLISLSKRGQAQFAPLEKASQQQIRGLLQRLPDRKIDDLLAAMQSIELTLGDDSKATVPYLIRSHTVGDMGWVVHMHGKVYGREYGWNEHFDAFVAKLVADYIENEDPVQERCWIAEQNGQNIGSAFIVKKSKHVAQLRMLIVDPKARGLGVGSRLVDECIRFSREAGYRSIVLWTNDILHAARKIYQRAGFVMVSQEAHQNFGHRLVGQNWKLDL